jgi:hypothetical protein
MMSAEFLDVPTSTDALARLWVILDGVIVVGQSHLECFDLPSSFPFLPCVRLSVRAEPSQRSLNNVSTPNIHTSRLLAKFIM